MGFVAGVAEPWKDIAEVLPNYQNGIWLASPQFVTQKRDVAQRWMVAWLKGAREYTDVFFKNKGDKAGMLAALIKYTPVKDAALYDKMGPTAVGVNGDVDAKNIAEQMEWYMGAGYVKTRLPVEKLVDNGLAEYAVKQLGRYQ